MTMMFPELPPPCLEWGVLIKNPSLTQQSSVLNSYCTLICSFRFRSRFKVHVWNNVYRYVGVLTLVRSYTVECE